MKKFKLGVALLIALTFGVTIKVLRDQNHTLVYNLNDKTNQLSFTKNELQQTKIRLILAEKQLGFLEKYKIAVQVTAYTRSHHSKVFADGKSAIHAYAVPQHTLPENKVVNVALSSTAQKKLHARMNDYLVLIHKRNHRKTLARFVDTIPDEKRPVVDVYFFNNRQAVLWGRKNDYYAVNISSLNSPFKRVLGN